MRVKEFFWLKTYNSDIEILKDKVFPEITLHFSSVKSRVNVVNEKWLKDEKKQLQNKKKRLLLEKNKKKQLLIKRNKKKHLLIKKNKRKQVQVKKGKKLVLQGKRNRQKYLLIKKNKRKQVQVKKEKKLDLVVLKKLFRRYKSKKEIVVLAKYLFEGRWQDIRRDKIRNLKNLLRKLGRKRIRNYKLFEYWSELCKQSRQVKLLQKFNNYSIRKIKSLIKVKKLQKVRNQKRILSSKQLRIRKFRRFRRFRRRYSFYKKFRKARLWRLSKRRRFLKRGRNRRFKYNLQPSRRKLSRRFPLKTNIRIGRKRILVARSGDFVVSENKALLKHLEEAVSVGNGFADSSLFKLSKFELDKYILKSSVVLKMTDEEKLAYLDKLNISSAEKLKLLRS